VFDFIRFVFRNPSYVTKHARRANETRKAMDDFRTMNGECAWCGRTKNLDVHHIVPVSVEPESAADPLNMLMLCRKPACHQIIGHNGDFARRYVVNAEEVCRDSGQQVVLVKGRPPAPSKACSHNERAGDHN